MVTSPFVMAEAIARVAATMRSGSPDDRTHKFRAATNRDPGVPALIEAHAVEHHGEIRIRRRLPIR